MHEAHGRIDQYDKHFGMIAIKRGYITHNDLNKAHKMKIGEKIVNGRYRLIGEILFNEDLLSPSQIDCVVNELFIGKDELFKKHSHEN